MSVVVPTQFELEAELVTIDQSGHYRESWEPNVCNTLAPDDMAG